jgi:ABC-type polysaccharide/polyol phosphate export permease
MTDELSPSSGAREVHKRVLAYHTLVKYLVLKDLKVKSRGTYLSVAWTLLNPLREIGSEPRVSIFVPLR